MPVHYRGADWIRANWNPTMSPLGEAVAGLLGDLFLGIYHLNHTSLRKVDWANPNYIEFTYDRGLATTDFDELTRLVVLCHDRKIRCDVKGLGPGYLRLMFHQRGPEGPYHTRHPDIEEAVERVRTHFGYGPYYSTGVEAIGKERRRQRELEGWTAEHDDAHADGELAAAAACYARLVVHVSAGLQVESYLPDGWPWDWRDFKPSADPMRNLERAGALIAAEYDRLQRRQALEEQARAAAAVGAAGQGQP